MQGSDRNRRQNNIPAFQDPFAGFGMGGGRSLFSQVFDRDPFDDPFFSQPFGSFFGSPGGMWGPSAFLGRGSIFGGGGPLFGDGPFGQFGNQRGGFLEQRPFSSQQETHRGPVIEEIPDDNEANPEATNTPRRRPSGEPIVEHPDEDVFLDNARHPRNGRRQPGHFTSQPHNTSQSYSFSSVTYGGSEGAYYTSSTTRRAGADGIVEEEHEEQDSRAGKETKRLARGLGDKGHSVTRKRDAAGENFVETLHNLTEEEKNGFDQTWKKRAETSLPGWKRNRERLLDSGSSGYGGERRAALPSSRNVSGGWQGANQA